MLDASRATAKTRPVSRVEKRLVYQVELVEEDYQTNEEVLLLAGDVPS